jgi:hypothetical protein
MVFIRLRRAGLCTKNNRSSQDGNGKRFGLLEGEKRLPHSNGIRILAHMPFPDLTKLQDLIPILVFLLPGFVSSGIVSLMVVRKPQEVFSRVVEAVIFTAMNLAVFFIAKAILSRIAVLNVTFKHFLTVDSHRFFTAGNLTMLGLCAVGIGLVWSFEANNQWLFRIFRWAKITDKSTKPSIWVDVFIEQRDCYAVVHLKDGRRLIGWVSRFSEDAADRALFLEQASWLTDDGNLVNNPRINVLVDRETEISFIEFVKPRKEPATRPETTAAAGGSSIEPTELSVARPRRLPRVWLCTAAVISYLFLQRLIRRHEHE